MIRIGVSSCLFHPSNGRDIYRTKTLCYIENDLALYLNREGVIPVLVPKLSGPALKSFAAKLDGLVLQGGVDISPTTYGDDFLDEAQWPGDAVRDQYELELIDYFFQTRKPILGICRGMQLINVYQHGTLYQDIPSQIQSPFLHRDREKNYAAFHPVRFQPGGTLARLYADEPYPNVGTVHHQAIKKLGDDLVVEAVCPDDGIIEAIAYRDIGEQWVLGVQWHPEFRELPTDMVVDSAKLLNLFLGRVSQ